MKPFFSLTGNRHFLLVAILFLMLGSLPVSAETPTEDFENLTLTDADGQPLANSWSFGYGLSNGWKIMGGSILASAGSTDYGLVKSTGKGHGESDHFLEASYGSTNSASVFVSQQMTGTLKFWVKSNLDSRSKKSSSVKILEANADGTVTSTVLFEYAPAKGGAWEEKTVTGLSGKYIAINLVYSNFDDLYIEGQGGGEEPPVVEERRALTMTAFERVSDYELTADEQNDVTVSFTLKVKNTGNVKLGADEVSVSVTDRDGTPYATVTATGDSLAVDGEKEIPVTVVTQAAESGYMSFYARENVTGTFMKDNWGNNMYQNIHVATYIPKFAINGPDGYVLYADETIGFGYTNIPVSRVVTIKNDGTAPLSVSNITLPNGYTASETAFSVAAGTAKGVTLTLTPAQPYGQKGGSVTITHALGTFTFAVSGVTVDPDCFFENFESQALPAAWTNEGSWTVNSQSGNYYAQQTNNAGEATRLVLPKMAVSEGESLAWQAKKSYAYSTNSTLSVYYSADKQNWTRVFNSENLTSAFEDLATRQIPAGNYYVAFEGLNVAIDNIRGYRLVTDEPVLAVLDARGNVVSSGSVLDFGVVTRDSIATYSVRNAGTGMLTAAVTVSEGFAVEPASVSLEAGQETRLSVKLIAEPWGEKSGVLTIGSDFTLTLKGVSRDPEAIFVDFQDQQWPRGWTAGANWSISHESYSSTEYYAEHVDHNGVATPIVTSKLVIGENDVMVFDARRYNTIYTSRLKVSYSADREQWTALKDYTSLLTSDFARYEVSGIPVGEYYLMIEGANVDIDNIEGFRLAQGDHLVELSATVPESATINWLYKATATVRNLAADQEEVTLRFMLGGKELERLEHTLAYGESQTLEYAYTPHAPFEAPVEAYFELTYAGKTVKSVVRTFNVDDESDETDAHLLSGVATDQSQAKQPLAGVTIRLVSNVSEKEEVIYETTTGADGSFSLKVWRGNLTYRLTASKEGYKDAVYEGVFFVTDRDDYEVTLEEDETTAIRELAQPSSQAVCTDLSGRTVPATVQRKGILILRPANGQKARKVIRK